MPSKFLRSVGRILGLPVGTRSSVIQQKYNELSGCDRATVIAKINKGEGSIASPAVPPTVWKTKDGKEIEIAEMDDSHLVNAIRFITTRRKARKRPSPNNHAENALRVEAARRGIDLCEDMPALPEPPKFVRVGVKIVRVKKPTDPLKSGGPGKPRRARG